MDFGPEGKVWTWRMNLVNPPRAYFLSRKDAASYGLKAALTDCGDVRRGSEQNFLGYVMIDGGRQLELDHNEHHPQKNI